LYVAAGNVVTTGFLANGSIVYSGTDNVTLQPGFSASVVSGTGTFTAQLGPCNIDGQLMPPNPQHPEAYAAARASAKGITIDRNIAIKIYPNPFNSITNVEIDLPAPANVSVSIYDMAGRLVDNPVRNKPLLTGKNKITYTNNRLTANVYLLVVETGGKRFTEKLIKM